MIRFLYPTFPTGRGAVGLFIVRAVTGAAFIQHGWPKIQNPFGWMPGESPPPAVLQALAALSEFGGGIALILGLLTPLAAFGIACTMVTGIGIVHLRAGDPFVSATGGRSWELAAVYLAIMILLLLVGPGSFSVDALLFGKRAQAAARVPEIR